MLLRGLAILFWFQYSFIMNVISCYMSLTNFLHPPSLCSLAIISIIRFCQGCTCLHWTKDTDKENIIFTNNDIYNNDNIYKNNNNINIRQWFQDVIWQGRSTWKNPFTNISSAYCLSKYSVMCPFSPLLLIFTSLFLSILLFFFIKFPLFYHFIILRNWLNRL